MPKIASLAKALSADFPEIKFLAGDDFRWSNQTATVHYMPEDTEEALANLLHETGHGLLGHQAFKFDIDLLKIERSAWVYAQERLAPRYNLSIDDDLIEDSLDSYRDWLHQRSRCPRCAQTGLENDDKTYTCLNCRTDWRPNEARRCGLKRYIKQI